MPGHGACALPQLSRDAGNTWSLRRGTQHTAKTRPPATAQGKKTFLHPQAIRPFTRLFAVCTMLKGSSRCPNQPVSLPKPRFPEKLRFGCGINNNQEVLKCRKGRSLEIMVGRPQEAETRSDGGRLLVSLLTSLTLGFTLEKTSISWNARAGGC